MADSSEADEARKRGRAVGYSVQGEGVDCPYTHAVLELRQSWFEGFGEGRADYERDHPHTAQAATPASP